MIFTITLLDTLCILRRVKGEIYYSLTEILGKGSGRSSRKVTSASRNADIVLVFNPFRLFDGIGFRFFIIFRFNAKFACEFARFLDYRM